MFEQITALHQQVREFAEKEEPNYSVTSINGYSKTEYESLDYFLANRTAHFSIQMIHTANRRYTLSLEVEVAEVIGGDGQLFIARHPQVGRV